MVPSLTSVSPQVHVAFRPCTWAHLGTPGPARPSGQVLRGPACLSGRARLWPASARLPLASFRLLLRTVPTPRPQLSPGPGQCSGPVATVVTLPAK